MTIFFHKFWLPKIVTFLAFAFLSVILLINAWVVDDAYISFRTVDNFLNGYGLTWNIDERVQSYTHPLWMLVVTLFHFITHEFFFTVILLSLFVSMASVLIGLKITIRSSQDIWWKSILLTLALMASKSFIDYSSSGLENPLSYLITAAFYHAYLSIYPSTKNELQVDEKKVGWLLFLAALAFVNRMDTIILFVPAIVWSLYRLLGKSKWHLFRIMLISTLPATLWLIFSLVYYGFPYPNTAYAKSFSTGFPLLWKLQRGLEYQVNSFSWDTASYSMLALALWATLKKRSSVDLTAMTGIALYILYTIFTGASATHMSGRFYAVPMFIAIIIFVKGIATPRIALVTSALLALYILWSPVSAIKFGTLAYQAYPQNPSYIDTKWYVYNEGAALLNWRTGIEMPNHEWYKWGKSLHRSSQKVFIGGAFGMEAIGYAGFAAGPEKHFIDIVGLSDPLLARLPAYIPPTINEWKSGHFHRAIPDGYIESIETGSNKLRDPNLRAYYDIIRIITRGSLFTTERMKAIININLGRYDYLIANIK